MKHSSIHHFDRFAIMQNLQRIIFSLAFLPFAKLTRAASNLSAVLPLTATGYGTTLTAQINIGGHLYDVLPDTGSADLWVLQKDWKCYNGQANVSGTPVSQDECQYGTTAYTESDTFEPIDDAWLGITYGAGDVFGTLGYESMRLGSISIPRQEFGLMNATTGPADRYSSGLVGLSLPIISQTHPSNVTGLTGFELLTNTLMYDTVLLTLEAQGVEPYFAFALDRIPQDQEIGEGKFGVGSDLRTAWLMSFRRLPQLRHHAACCLQRVPHDASGGDGNDPTRIDGRC